VLIKRSILNFSGTNTDEGDRSRVLKRVFITRREEVTGEFRKLLEEEVGNNRRLQNIA